MFKYYVDQYDLTLHCTTEFIFVDDLFNVKQCISMRTDFCTLWKLYKNMKINATALANHTI